MLHVYIFLLMIPQFSFICLLRLLFWFLLICAKFRFAISPSPSNTLRRNLLKMNFIYLSSSSTMYFSWLITCYKLFIILTNLISLIKNSKSTRYWKQEVVWDLWVCIWISVACIIILWKHGILVNGWFGTLSL